MTGTETVARGPGRPPDPALETRTYRAALEIYELVGWAGFTINAVATRAKVGKAAIYSRWGSKSQLIAEAAMSLDVGRPPPDTGSLRQDLIDTVTGELEDYLSPGGIVKLRAQLEAKIYPELLGSAMERVRKHRYEGGRAIIGAAVKRGELPSAHDGTLLLDAIGGMTINHFLSTPADHLPQLRKNMPRFATTVVDFALRAMSVE